MFLKLTKVFIKHNENVIRENIIKIINETNKFNNMNEMNI